VSRIGNAARGIWRFVAGDDWVTAGGVVAALGITAAIDGMSDAWIVMPVAVGGLLALSIWREARTIRATENLGYSARPSDEARS
jgi:hypothetical protein